MSVLVRPKRGESNIRRRRQRPVGRDQETVSASGEAAAGAPTDAASAPKRRRELGPLQDQALYTCQCGFVFEATVSTSVQCPHCGGAQAW
jgi:hypothetical protein